MIDKEYRMANFATFVSKILTFSPQKMDEFNFKPAQYCINKIFELTKSCIWSIFFGLKSYLCFQIELALRAWSILKSRVWLQHKLLSTQFNYHYLSPWKGGPGPGQGDFEENTRGTEKSGANEGHQSLFIAWEEGGGGEAESENFGGNTGGTEKFIANEEHQSLFIAWEEGCGVGRLWGEHRGNREVKSK